MITEDKNKPCVASAAQGLWHLRNGIEQQMFDPEDKPIWGGTLHVAVELLLVTDVETGLAVEDELYGGCNVEVVQPTGCDGLAEELCHDVEVDLLVTLVSAGQHELAC